MNIKKRLLHGGEKIRRLRGKILHKIYTFQLGCKVRFIIWGKNGRLTKVPVIHKIERKCDFFDQ